MTPEEKARVFAKQLIRAGLDPTSVPYLARLAAGIPGGQLPDLEALAKAPRIRGNRVIITPIELELVFTGSHWTPIL